MSLDNEMQALNAVLSSGNTEAINALLSTAIEKGKSPGQTDVVEKALTEDPSYVHGTVSVSGQTGTNAMQFENVSPTIKLICATDAHLSFIKKVERKKVDSLTVQWVIQNEYGLNKPLTYSPTAFPENNVSQWAREIVALKPFAVEGQVGLVANALGGRDVFKTTLVQREMQSRQQHMLRQLELMMFHGSTTVSSTTEVDGLRSFIKTYAAKASCTPAQFVGYDMQISGSNTPATLDVADSYLTPSVIEAAINMTFGNAGYANTMYVSSEALSNFNRHFYNIQRQPTGSSPDSGSAMKRHDSALDIGVEMHKSIYLRCKNIAGTNIPATSVNPGVAAAPTCASSASPADAASKFLAADAGTYSYKISAVYVEGETLPSTNFEVAVSAGDKVTVEITYTGTPLYFNVYRSAKGNATKWHFLNRIAKGSSGAAHTIDLNADAPASSAALLLDFENENITWQEMVPMTTVPIPATLLGYRWAHCTVGALLVGAPSKCVVLENIKGGVSTAAI